MIEWAAAIRSLHLAAFSLLVGGLGFALLVARPAFKQSGAGALDICRRFERYQLKASWGALLGILFTSLPGLLFQVAAVADLSLSQVTAGDVSEVVTGTRYGRVWLLRLALLVLFAILLAAHRYNSRERGDRFIGWGTFLLACAALETLAFSGHAAAGEGKTLFIQVMADAAHLFAAALWLGGLAPLAVLLHWSRGGDSVSIAQEAVRRFSLLGTAAVPLILFTGWLNAQNMVGGFVALVGTSYGGLLLLKLAVILPLLGLAAVNLYRLKPGLLGLGPQASRHEFQTLLGWLKRSVVMEAGLGVFVLAIVGWMALTPPARHVQPSWPFSFRLTWVALQGGSNTRAEIFFGATLIAFGVIALSVAALRRRERYWTSGVALAGLAYGGAVILPALSIDAYPTTYMRPPVPYHAISVGNGLGLYRENCALCHGVAGYGDGPVAEKLVPRPTDLTAGHTGQHTAGDLFWWVSFGIPNTAMPGFGAALSPEERWDLINFIRALSAAEQARAMFAGVEPTPWLVAPDFAYLTAQGEAKSLRDHRGERIVLLALFTLPDSRQRLGQLDQAYPTFKSLGVEVLAIPGGGQPINSEEASFVRGLPVVTDGSPEAFEVYALFRRSFSEQGSFPEPPAPRHMEFLIDRQGYIRARWIPGEGAGWAEMKHLVREIERLNAEQTSVAAPDEHVH